MDGGITSQKSDWVGEDDESSFRHPLANFQMHASVWAGNNRCGHQPARSRSKPRAYVTAPRGMTEHAKRALWTLADCSVSGVGRWEELRQRKGAGMSSEVGRRPGESRFTEVILESQVVLSPEDNWNKKQTKSPILEKRSSLVMLVRIRLLSEQTTS